MAKKKLYFYDEVGNQHKNYNGSGNGTVLISTIKLPASDSSMNLCAGSFRDVNDVLKKEEKADVALGDPIVLKGAQLLDIMTYPVPEVESEDFKREKNKGAFFFDHVLS